MNKLMRFFLILILVIILHVPASPCFAAGFTKEAIEFEARSLMNRIEITRDVSYRLKNRLSAALKDSSLSETIAARGVGAVFVYAAGEGGILIKYMGGDGLVSFDGGRQAAPFDLGCLSFGMMIGGSAQWGIGLVIGRADEKSFGGWYKGGTRTATAWEAATGAILYVSRTMEDRLEEIYIVTTGRGLSAGLGSVNMNIAPAW